MTAHQDGGSQANTQRSGPYALLSAYGLLGDGHAGALVAADGAIDWLAAPRLDSPPICATLLEPADGGSFTLAPAVEYEADALAIHAGDAARHRPAGPARPGQLPVVPGRRAADRRDCRRVGSGEQALLAVVAS